MFDYEQNLEGTPKTLPMCLDVLRTCSTRFGHSKCCDSCFEALLQVWLRLIRGKLTFSRSYCLRTSLYVLVNHALKCNRACFQLTYDILLLFTTYLSGQPVTKVILEVILNHTTLILRRLKTGGIQEALFGLINLLLSSSLCSKDSQSLKDLLNLLTELSTSKNPVTAEIALSKLQNLLSQLSEIDDPTRTVCIKALSVNFRSRHHNRRLIALDLLYLLLQRDTASGYLYFECLLGVNGQNNIPIDSFYGDGPLKVNQFASLAFNENCLTRRAFFEFTVRAFKEIPKLADNIQYIFPYIAIGILDPNDNVALNTFLSLFTDERSRKMKKRKFFNHELFDENKPAPFSLYGLIEHMRHSSRSDSEVITFVDGQQVSQTLSRYQLRSLGVPSHLRATLRAHAIKQMPVIHKEIGHSFQAARLFLILMGITQFEGLNQWDSTILDKILTTYNTDSGLPRELKNVYHLIFRYLGKHSPFTIFWDLLKCLFPNESVLLGHWNKPICILILDQLLRGYFSKKLSNRFASADIVAYPYVKTLKNFIHNNFRAPPRDSMSIFLDALFSKILRFWLTSLESTLKMQTLLKFRRLAWLVLSKHNQMAIYVEESTQFAIFCLLTFTKYSVSENPGKASIQTKGQSRPCHILSTSPNSKVEACILHYKNIIGPQYFSKFTKFNLNEIQTLLQHKKKLSDFPGYITIAIHCLICFPSTPFKIDIGLLLRLAPRRALRVFYSMKHMSILQFRTILSHLREVTCFRGKILVLKLLWKGLLSFPSLKPEVLVFIAVFAKRLWVSDDSSQKHRILLLKVSAMRVLSEFNDSSMRVWSLAFYHFRQCLENKEVSFQVLVIVALRNLFIKGVDQPANRHPDFLNIHWWAAWMYSWNGITDYKLPKLSYSSAKKMYSPVVMFLLNNCNGMKQGVLQKDLKDVIVETQYVFLERIKKDWTDKGYFGRCRILKTNV